MGAPIERVFKFIALVSLIHGGWSKSLYEDIRKDLVAAYGFESLIYLNNLSKNGLFKKQDKQFPWEDIREKLALINDQVNLNQQTDLAHSYQGYVPIL